MNYLIPDGLAENSCMMAEEARIPSTLAKYGLALRHRILAHDRGISSVNQSSQSLRKNGFIGRYRMSKCTLIAFEEILSMIQSMKFDVIRRQAKLPILLQTLCWSLITNSCSESHCLSISLYVSDDLLYCIFPLPSWIGELHSVQSTLGRKGHVEKS